MSDKHRESINVELTQHELVELADVYNVVIHQLDSRKGEHSPPALMAMMKVLLNEGLAKGVPVHQILLASFLMGIEEGKKGKSYEDYTRCSC
jgi:hypothetical protein